MALGSLVSDSVVVADNGRLTIAFAGSNLVLEGFYSSNGLLLRLVDGAAGAVTNVAQGVLFGTKLLRFSDADGDGVNGDIDNCPFNFNPQQENTDEDLFGDVCDSDIDGDTFDNNEDNCPLDVNPLQEDDDNNGVGNTCDVSSNAPSVTVDGDIYMLDGLPPLSQNPPSGAVEGQIICFLADAKFICGPLSLGGGS